MGKIRHQKNKTKSKKKIEILPEEIEQPMDDVIDDENDLAEHNEIDFDKRSVVSNKTIKSLVSKKKDKIKLKRQFLLKRLHAAHESKREAKERAERRKTVIVSDMKNEFENSLGQIESYLEEQRLALAEKKNTRKQVLSQAERNRQSQANIDIFNKISQSIEYSTNPFELIKKQLEQQIIPSTKKKS
ncbi:unnamed protein product [Rotaria sp. Silwood1]|nr:unnamed protein product [Rotaria sp. Silwood1]CAF1361567.1 unnamed protein product [Rotaria sp. Silwood1]CAF1367630.1 unnamed protein product [Rotaria sp. Silwood1]CAF3507142.1 unnamed protein product [Rotaria sp. Silwood1]CAF3574007.1 unnamed protein product [Rotaria sp. Silwood1]